MTGEMVEWKGKYGWIKPHEPVDHPAAGAHRGRLYVHLVDLEWWVKALAPKESAASTSTVTPAGWEQRSAPS